MIRIALRDIYSKSRQPLLGRVTWLYAVMGFAVLAAATVGFAEIADEVREQSTLVYDQAVLRWFHSFQSHELDLIVKRITDMGDVVGIALIGGVLAVGLWRVRKYAAMVQLAAGVGGAVVLNLILKGIFMRDRPSLWEHFVTETSYSFPSGHAMASSALALSAMVILWQTRWRWWAVAFGGAYMIAIGCTRLYLGVHYPTDIIAGWCVSAMWVVIVALCTGALGVRKSKKSSQ